MSTTTTGSGWRGTVAAAALGWALFAVAWFAVAAIGTRFGLWSWQFGLGQMMGNVAVGYGRWIIVISAGLSVIALVVALIASPRVRPTMLALAAILITLFVGGRWMGFQLTALSLPPLHEASTDWDDPVVFSNNLLEKREIGQCDSDGDGAVSETERSACPLNPVVDFPMVELSPGAQERWPGFHGKTVAEVQQDGERDPALGGKDADEKPYPPMNTATTTLDQNTAFEVAIDLVSKRGWKIVGANHEAGRIEATETSTWFGFKDDVALRVRALETGGTEIDMRSVSRVGLSDLGANSKRVSGFMADLERALAEAERTAGQG